MLDDVISKSMLAGTSSTINALYTAYTEAGTDECIALLILMKHDLDTGIIKRSIEGCLVV